MDGDVLKLHERVASIPITEMGVQFQMALEEQMNTYPPGKVLLKTAAYPEGSSLFFSSSLFREIPLKCLSVCACVCLSVRKKVLQIDSNFHNLNLILSLSTSFDFKIPGGSTAGDIG